MIQTQLLRLDPPYQIIGARGLIGIQLATLIVTEDETTGNGRYCIDTHSHPVVSYGLKEWPLQHKAPGNPAPSVPFYLQPEGAVWNKVEIDEVEVLGVAGAQNEEVSLSRFLRLIPTDNRYSRSPWNGGRVWDMNSVIQIHELYASLLRFNLKTEKKPYPGFKDDEGRTKIHLSLDCDVCSEAPLVYVEMGEGEASWFTSFRVEFSSEVEKTADIIYPAMKALGHYFAGVGDKLHFDHIPDKANDDGLEEAVGKLTEQLNKRFS